MKNPPADGHVHRRFAPTALMLGNIVTGCSVLAPAGMLIELSSDLGVTVHAAGLLITFGAVMLCVGSPLTAWLNARAVRGAGDAVTAVEVIVEDVTERLRIEEHRRREQTLEAVGQLAAGVAHHFNNLLTGMLGFTELLSAQAGLSAEMKEDLGQILKSGKRATDAGRYA